MISYFGLKNDNYTREIIRSIHVGVCHSGFIYVIQNEGGGHTGPHIEIIAKDKEKVKRIQSQENSTDAVHWPP